MFASSFHPHFGGVEELVRQLALRQREAGARPVVHTMRWPRNLPSREEWYGLQIRRHSFRAPEGSPRNIAAARLANPLVLAALVRQLRADRCELIHVQCVNLGAGFAYRAARLLRLPFVVSTQGELSMDSARVYERSASLRRTLRLVLERADMVTACSRATLQEAEEWAGLTLGERGRTVFNGVDNREFRSGRSISERPFVFAIGRHVPQKGFDVLIDAFAEVVADPDFGWDLIVAGDGPEHGALVDQAAERHLTDRVRFVGRTDRAATVALFQRAAVFVLPSRQEPFGIVNLEAMAAGTPVVATRVGGVVEFVEDGRCGLLVPPNDPRAMAGAIRNLWQQPELRERLAEAGRARAKLLDWTGIEAQYREVYSSARSHHEHRLARAA
jgi:glycosyltransferase involved in cell wall biosynthesis